MNKADLIALIQSMPDNLETDLIQIDECSSQQSAWAMVWNSEPSYTAGTVYKKRVETTLTLRLNFSGQVQGTFRRDRFGHDCWSNIHFVNDSGESLRE